MKNHVYLYECEGYHEGGKVKSKIILVGKLVPKTKIPIYKEDYINRMNALGTPIVKSDIEKCFSANDIKKSSIKDVGLTKLFVQLADTSGFREELNVSNPKYCNEIFALIKHLASNGELLCIAKSGSKMFKSTRIV